MTNINEKLHKQSIQTALSGVEINYYVNVLNLLNMAI
jgi:hypothetical protein